MQISTGKTVSVVISKEEHRCKLGVDGGEHLICFYYFEIEIRVLKKLFLEKRKPVIWTVKLRYANTVLISHKEVEICHTCHFQNILFVKL